MTKYIVTIEEKLVYRIEVEADTEEQAESEAYNSPEFTSNLSNDNDSEVTSVAVVEE